MKVMGKDDSKLNCVVRWSARLRPALKGIKTFPAKDGEAMKLNTDFRSQAENMIVVDTENEN